MFANKLQFRKVWKHCKSPIHSVVNVGNDYLNYVGFRSLRTKTLCMCVSYTIGGGGGGGGVAGGGGWTFKSVVWSLISPLVEKKVHFLTQKSRHAKFQQIPSNLKICNEIGTYAHLPWSPSIIIPEITIINLSRIPFIPKTTPIHAASAQADWSKIVESWKFPKME